jgi:hypothetical protein
MECRDNYDDGVHGMWPPRKGSSACGCRGELGFCLSISVRFPKIDVGNQSEEGGVQTADVGLGRPSRGGRRGEADPRERMGEEDGVFFSILNFLGVEIFMLMVL